MSIEEMESMFKGEKEEPILVDKLRFKKELGMGEETYKYLNSFKQVEDFISSISVGAASSGIAGVSWYSSLGWLSQVGLSMGFVSLPVGWLALVGIGGAACAHITKKIHKKLIEGCVDKVPKHISTPMALLAEGVLDLLLPPIIRVAYSDSKLSSDEYAYITDLFHNKWGYNIRYVKKKSKSIKSLLIQMICQFIKNV